MDSEVIDSEGVRGRIVGRVQREGAPERVAVAADDKHFLIPTGVIEQREQGRQFLPESFESFERIGDEEAAILPVIEEQLRVTTQPREERVRVEKRVGTREESLDLPVTEDVVEIERVAVNREVERPFEAHYDGDTFIVPLFEETLVTRKRLVLREEIRITKRRVERTVQESVRLRREEATVFREGSSRPETPGQSSRPGDNSAEEK